MPRTHHAHATHTPCARLQHTLEHDHRLARAGGSEDDVRRAAVAVGDHILHCRALQSVELRLDRLDRAVGGGGSVGGGAGGGDGGGGCGGQQVCLGGQERHDVREVLGDLIDLHHDWFRDVFAPVVFSLEVRLAQRAQLPLPLHPHVLHAEQVAHELHRLPVECEAQVAVAQVRPPLLARHVRARRVARGAVLDLAHARDGGVQQGREDIGAAVAEERGADVAQHGLISAHDEGRAVDHVDHPQPHLAEGEAEGGAEAEVGAEGEAEGEGDGWLGG